MKRTIAALAAGALALGALAGTAGAAPNGKAHGKHIQEECGLSFGELRDLLADGPTLKRGAKHFATAEFGAAALCADGALIPPAPAPEPDPDPDPEPDPIGGGFGF